MAFCDQFADGLQWASLLTLAFLGMVLAPPAVSAGGPPTPIAVACIGDCNHDGAVTVDDLLAMVNISLGIADVSTCLAGDANNDGQITIDDILVAVNNALNDCPTVVHTVVVGPNGNLRFNPPTLTINVGDTVQWTWASSAHSVNSGSNCVNDNQFCSPNDSDCAQAPLSNLNATYSHTFTSPGTFPYFCTPHCDFGMVGTITVQ